MVYYLKNKSRFFVNQLFLFKTILNIVSNEYLRIRIFEFGVGYVPFLTFELNMRKAERSLKYILKVDLNWPEYLWTSDVFTSFKISKQFCFIFRIYYDKG